MNLVKDNSEKMQETVGHFTGKEHFKPATDWKIDRKKGVQADPLQTMLIAYSTNTWLENEWSKFEIHKTC